MDAKSRPDHLVILTFIDSSSGEKSSQIVDSYVPYCYVSTDFGAGMVQKTEPSTGSIVNVAKIAVSARPKETKVGDCQIGPEMSCVFVLSKREDARSQ